SASPDSRTVISCWYDDDAFAIWSIWAWFCCNKPLSRVNSALGSADPLPAPEPDGVGAGVDGVFVVSSAIAPPTIPIPMLGRLDRLSLENLSGRTPI